MVTLPNPITSAAGTRSRGSRVVGRDPVVAESSRERFPRRALGDDALLVHPGRQPEQDVVAGVETGDGHARHPLRDGRDEGVAASAVTVANPAQVPVETTGLDQPRQRRLVELGDPAAGEVLLGQDARRGTAVG